ncbi:MAG: internal scaffolding protein [Microviridae sp.]|nr:MAG: internal scaffolding protein [Microviridae sp.]
MKVPFVRSAYNYDMSAASDESALLCDDVSLTVQSSVEEVDINTIVRRFGLTGQLPDAVDAPTYGDFVGITDYHSAMNAVAEANEAFELMPAEVRARFGNDPAAFVDFCSDDGNRAEAEKLGLVLPKAAPVVESAPVGAPKAS